VSNDGRPPAMTIREAIYAAIVATGNAPSAEAIALRYNLDQAAVADVYRTLADAHVIVLERGRTTIAFAPPFSAGPTAFRVAAGAREFYAPCAWDAFGIPAALKSDARVDARCAWSDEPLPCGVENGQAFGDGVIHLLVPAAHFWDDIFYT
jgi:alkylmercury lyase-like protein